MTRRKEEAPAAATAQGLGFPKLNRSDCERLPMSAQALKVLEGERQAHEFLERLRAQQSGADDLAVIVSMLYGPALRGFCSALVKALGVRHV